MFLIGGRDPIWRGQLFASRLGAGAGGAGPGRVIIGATEGVGFSAHSFLAFASQVTGDGGSAVFPSLWTGPRFLNYMGFSTLKARWDANGVDRTGDYSGALWLTEFVNPADGGWPAPDSTAGRETLQYLFWYALTAQRKGCKAVILYPPWSPEGMGALDGQTMSWFQRMADWLRARPEITIPVYITPVPAIVAGFRAFFAPQSIYSDGLHLRGPNDAEPNKHMDALAVGLDMMMTGTRPANDPSWTAEMIAQVDIVWAAIRDYACTGLGGTITVTPTPVSADPLPDPAPLLRYGVGEGQIGIHLSTDGARLDGSGQVTSLVNQGGAGTLFDAAVSGAPLVRSGAMVQLSDSTGVPVLATPADLIGVRLMWAMQPASAPANYRVFGRASASGVRIARTASQESFYLWQSSPAVNRTLATYPLPSAGQPHLYELEMMATGAELFIDGASFGTGSISAASFLVDAISRGPDAADRYAGLMGDILGVRLGAGADAAIAEARAYLRRRFPGLPQ